MSYSYLWRKALETSHSILIYTTFFHRFTNVPLLWSYRYQHCFALQGQNQNRRPYHSTPVVKQLIHVFLCAPVQINLTTDELDQFLPFISFYFRQTNKIPVLTIITQNYTI